MKKIRSRQLARQHGWTKHIIPVTEQWLLEGWFKENIFKGYRFVRSSTYGHATVYVYDPVESILIKLRWNNGNENS